MLSIIVALTLLCSVNSGRLPYIIGGVDVEPVGKWPFQVSLQYLGSHSCGAALISDEWVLSAGHCVDGRSIRDMSVIVGAYDIKTQEQGDPVSINVDEIILHEDYGSFTAINDMALLHLSTPADLTDEFVDTVSLAPSNAPTFVGYNCYLIGWGSVVMFDFGGGIPIYPNILQEAQSTVYSNGLCNILYGNIEDFHICLGLIGSSGACFGDSGGPAVCDVDGTWTHVGVASRVYDGLCTVSHPTVYTRTSYYRDWIRENSGV